MYAGWGAIRRLSVRLLRKLGIEVAWRQEQKRRQKKQQANTAAEAQAKVEDNTALLAELIQPVRRPPHASSSAAAHDAQATLERNRRLAELAAAGVPLAEVRQWLNHAAHPP